jgi:hypothetical protein
MLDLVISSAQIVSAGLLTGGAIIAGTGSASADAIVT